MFSIKEIPSKLFKRIHSFVSGLCNFFQAKERETIVFLDEAKNHKSIYYFYYTVISVLLTIIVASIFIETNINPILQLMISSIFLGITIMLKDIGIGIYEALIQDLGFRSIFYSLLLVTIIMFICFIKLTKIPNINKLVTKGKI